MSNITKKEMLREVKSYVAKLGFTFKVNDKQYINNQTCYKLCKRYSGEIITNKYGNDLSSFTLDSGYSNMLNGYFNHLAQDESHYHNLNK